MAEFFEEIGDTLRGWMNEGAAGAALRGGGAVGRGGAAAVGQGGAAGQGAGEDDTFLPPPVAPEGSTWRLVHITDEEDDLLTDEEEDGPEQWGEWLGVGRAPAPRTNRLGWFWVLESGGRATGYLSAVLRQ